LADNLVFRLLSENELYLYTPFCMSLTRAFLQGENLSKKSENACSEYLDQISGSSKNGENSKAMSFTHCTLHQKDYHNSLVVTRGCKDHRVPVTRMQQTLKTPQIITKLSTNIMLLQATLTFALVHYLTSTLPTWRQCEPYCGPAP
jgi:hypothetical protein